LAREVLPPLPRAEAVLRGWQAQGEPATLQNLFERHRGAVPAGRARAALGSRWPPLLHPVWTDRRAKAPPQKRVAPKAKTGHREHACADRLIQQYRQPANRKRQT
jgi:hypothetical protein